MFAVLYMGYVKEGCESEYQKHWHIIASHFINHCGALGSCLHQAENGIWVAYSRWPDKETRDSAWPSDNSMPNDIPENISQAIIAIKDCLDQERQLPDVCMTVMDDMLS